LLADKTTLYPRLNGEEKSSLCKSAEILKEAISALRI